MKNSMRKKQRAYFWLMGLHDKAKELREKYVILYYDGMLAYKASVKANKRYSKSLKRYSKKYGVK